MNGEPEQGQYQPRDDGHVRAPEAPACARDDGEGDVVGCADGAIGGDYNGDDKEGDGDDDEGVAEGETDGEHATGELPGGDVEGVGDPVCYYQ